MNKKAKGKVEVEDRINETGGYERVATREGLSHQSTIYSDSPMNPETSSRWFAIHSPFDAEEVSIRMTVKQAEQFLSDCGLPTESTDKLTLPERIYGLPIPPPDGPITPFHDEAIAAETVFHGRRLLEGIDKHERLIDHAIRYGRATSLRQFFSRKSKIHSNHAKKDRNKLMRPAVREWVAEHPNLKSARLLWNALPGPDLSEPNAGKFVFWREGEKAYALNEQTYELKPCKFSQFEKYVLEAKKKKKNT